MSDTPKLVPAGGPEGRTHNVLIRAGLVILAVLERILSLIHI